jgi:hypothetical protein
VIFFLRSGGFFNVVEELLVIRDTHVFLTLLIFFVGAAFSFNVSEELSEVVTK